MAKGDLVGNAEKVVRAGLYPYWDSNLGRASPSAFTQVEVSVSRLAILPLEQIVAIFKKDFNERVHPDGESMMIRGIGLATVADIIEQAEKPLDEKGKKLPNITLTVIEDKIENEPNASDNPAHALICGWSRENPSQPRKISRGVANRLLDAFSWKSVSD